MNVSGYPDDCEQVQVPDRPADSLSMKNCSPPFATSLISTEGPAPAILMIINCTQKWSCGCADIGSNIIALKVSARTCATRSVAAVGS